MHIGMIIDGLAGGGAERVVLTLAEALAARGHRVTLVNLRDACAYRLPSGVELFQVFDDYRGPLRRQTEITRRARQLDKRLRQRFGATPFDLTVASLPKTDRIVAATPCLADAWHCLHGVVASTQLAGKHGLKRWLKRRQLTATYDGRRLITVSDGIYRDLVSLTDARPSRHEVIPNPFDIEGIRALAAEPCPLDGESFLLHVGRFHPVKRHDRLFAAFARSGFDGKLVLLGDGNAQQRQRLAQQAAEQEVADRVVFAGFAENPYPYLRAARALVLSSDSEGFGNVLVEAMICGTPAISTRCPSGPESILTGNLMRCLSEPDPDSLAQTIRSVLADPPKIEDSALQRFSLDTITERYLALHDC